MIHHTSTTRNRQPKPVRRTAFTLIEMTIVIMIIVILAALALPVFNAAAQQAKVHRTRAIIAKLDQIIGEKWEAYRTRQVPVKIPGTMRPIDAAQIRLFAMRDLMRMELPDHREDVMDPPQIINQYAANPFNPNSSPQFYMKLGASSYNSPPAGTIPAVTKNYFRRAGASWAANPNDWSNDSAECLYMIVAATRDGDRNALDFFSKTEIGDTDNDGLNEILDAWGQPIIWFRSAPGYVGIVTTPQDVSIPDPFDPFKADPRWPNAAYPDKPFATKPLIVSSGPNKKFDLYLEFGFHSSQSNVAPYGSPCASDPFVRPLQGGSQMPYFGTPYDLDNSGLLDHADNITNHDLEAK